MCTPRQPCSVEGNRRIPTHRYRSPVALSLGVCFIATACAKLEYTKVPSRVQYGAAWTSDMQKEADALEGPRYYLPRPWVHLKRPVPVASRVAFLSLRYDTDSRRYEVSLPPEAESWLRRLIPKDIAISAAVARRLVGGAQQSGRGGGAASEEAPPSAAPPPTTVVGKVGFINDKDPVTELSSLLDVVYLPDFDEQFVIERSWGLGRGSLEVELRNGWAAEVFGEEVDRSNLVPYVIDQVENAADAAIEIAKRVAQASTGIPIGELPLGEVGRQQSGITAETEQAALDLLGNLVLLKVVEIRVAQPGLYPILKPREIVDWFGVDAAQPVAAAGADSQARFEQFLKQRGLPWIRPDQVFVPAPPLTMIAFNTTTDAYIGAVTKDELGLGARVVDEPGDTENGTAELVAAIQRRLRAPVATLTGPSASAAQKLNLDAPVIEKDDDPSRTKITLQRKAAADDLTDEEQAATVYRGWMASAFGLSEAEQSALQVVPSASEIEISGLPAMSRLADG